MAQAFSTDLVPGPDRLEAWRWYARQICGDCRFDFPKHFSFHGSIEGREIAGLELTRFSSSPLSFAKFPAATACPENRKCIVISQLQGVRSYSQGGALAILKPGDSTFIDSALPWTSQSADECARLYLRVPWWRLENRLRIGSLPTARRISGVSGLGATLYHVATSLYQEADHLTSKEGAAAIEAYLELLSGCIGRPERDLPNAGHCKELSSRIEKYLATHLGDPTLSPKAIAWAVGISVRHLHRLFAQQGLTVTDLVRERRLEMCRSDLSDPRLREKTITEIAFFWGFSDSAHFSRSFKNHFGICPRTFRSRICADSWNTLKTQDFVAVPNLRHLPPN